MTELTLYSMPSSGNSYKVRLLLAFTQRPYTHIGLEYGTQELKAAHSEKRLPLQKLPVLQLADGSRIPESNAILFYLAEGTGWLPQNPVSKATCLAWMFWEQNQHEAVIAVRAALLTYPHRKHLATPERLSELLERGNALLAQMEDHLARHDWFADETPTIADVSLYAYTHSAETKGGYNLSDFPAIRQWLDRFATLPGYVALDDIPA
ncbi:MAG: glutathione S-transferase family protein [Pseudomonadota bacterium]